MEKQLKVCVLSPQGDFMLLEDPYFRRACHWACESLSFVVHPTEPTTKILSTVYDVDSDGSEGWCLPE